MQPANLPAEPNVQQLMEAINSGNIDNVRLILRAGEQFLAGISGQDFLTRRLGLAAESGHAEILGILLDAGADPRRSSALNVAAFGGHVAAVRLLINDGRANPAMRESLPLWNAVVCGHAKIVQLLLEDRRADPAAGQNRAIVRAASHREFGILRLLLADGRANPNIDNGAMLTNAAWSQDVELVRVLMEYPHVVDPQNGASRAAGMAGNLEMVRVLLSSKKTTAERLAAVEAALMGADDGEVGGEVRSFLESYRDDIGNVRRIVDCMHALLPQRIDSAFTFLLAEAAVARGVDGASLRQLERGHLAAILNGIVGSSLARSFAETFSQAYTALAPLAAASSRAPYIELAGKEHNDPMSAIVYQLVPGLPEPAADAMWEAARSFETGIGPATSKERAFRRFQQAILDRCFAKIERGLSAWQRKPLEKSDAVVLDKMLSLALKGYQELSAHLDDAVRRTLSEFAAAVDERNVQPIETKLNTLRADTLAWERAVAKETGGLEFLRTHTKSIAAVRTLANVAPQAFLTPAAQAKVRAYLGKQDQGRARGVGFDR